MVLDPTASGGQLDHIKEFGSTPTITLPSGFNTSSARLTPVLISSGLPPIPSKLVTRAQDGLFIEMANLLPSKLISAEYYSSDNPDNPKQKHYQVSDIIEWIQCFGVYIAIISQKEPERTGDLMGYQQLIIHSSQNYHQDGWIVYDRHF